MLKDELEATKIFWEMLFDERLVKIEMLFDERLFYDGRSAGSRWHRSFTTVGWTPAFVPRPPHACRWTQDPTSVKVDARAPTTVEVDTRVRWTPAFLPQ